MRAKLFLVAISSLLVCGCGVGEQKITNSVSAPHKIILTAQQTAVLKTGIKQMVAAISTDAASKTISLARVKPFLLKGQGDTQVCGTVAFTEQAKNHLMSFYVELEESSGQPAAKRGQLGSDKLKAAKVSFMCRHAKIL